MSIKKIVIFMVCIIYMLTLSLSVHAESAATSVSSASINSAGTVNLSVTFSSSAGFANVYANISGSNGLTVNKVTGGFGTTQYYSSKLVSYGSDDISSVTFTVQCTMTGSPGSKGILSVRNVTLANISGVKSTDSAGADGYVTIISSGFQSTTRPPQYSDHTTISNDPNKSKNNNLISLSVEGLTLSPSFSPSITEYKLPDVPFETSEIKISAKAEDKKSKVSIFGVTLSEGKNVAMVQVKAENGAVKTYNIEVYRGTNPNYKSSDNAKLSEITVSAGVLSPAFAPEVTSYVVYVPYETQRITISAKSQDEKTSSLSGVVTDSELVVGKNVFSIVCVAEDKNTVLTYNVYVVRMSLFRTVDDLVLPKSDNNMTVPSKGFMNMKNPIWLTMLAGLLLFILGISIGYAIFTRKRGNHINDNDENIENNNYNDSENIKDKAYSDETSEDIMNKYRLD